MNDPLLSNEDLEEYTLRVKHPPRQKKVQKCKMISDQSSETDKITGDAEKENKNDKDSSCPLCSDSHDWDECKTLHEVIAEESIMLLYKEKLSYGCCYTCISLKHSSINWPNMKICKICLRRRPTRFKLKGKNTETREKVIQDKTAKNNCPNIDDIHYSTICVGNALTMWAVSMRVWH